MPCNESEFPEKKRNLERNKHSDPKLMDQDQF